jgi:nucleotide-binding universal stress UspA family protein
MFKKILVAIDASDYSIRALKKAVQMAKLYRSEITLLHVIDYPVQYLDMGLVVRNMPATAEENSKLGNQIFDLASKDIDLEGINVSRKTTSGHPATAILEESNNGYDLIVMGSVGHSPLGGMLIGSVTQRVLGKAACPVLVVK